jgi:citrate lyase subunit beta/citryl-CoA lyase
MSSTTRRAPALRRTWLFGPGADARAHRAMTASGADALVADLEDFTPPHRRPEARTLIPALIGAWRTVHIVACVRINRLEAEGRDDLAAVMPARPDVIVYPKTVTREQMRALDVVIGQLEERHNIAAGSTEILPVCETALGVVNVREIAGATLRIRCAMLGAEDLATDLCAERGRDAIELDHARRRFLLECRAAAVEPVDAPYTFDDVEGAVSETRYARRLGYRSKSLVLPAHAGPIADALTPSAEEVAQATRVVLAFDSARARGEDRALVDGLWIEVPTYANARRLLERAAELGAGPAS